MACCCAHHHHCCWYPFPPPETGEPRRGRWAAREDYVRNLEEERETLDARLRRLEREIEELRRASQKP